MGVHDDSTRAAHRRQRSATFVAVLAAILCWGGVAHSAPQAELEVSRAPDAFVPDTEIVHDIAIEMVGPGAEELRLSARLTDDGGVIERPLSWTIRTIQGEVVYAGQAPVAELRAEPGDYLVEARYGTVHFARTVSLPVGSRLMVSFVLNVGGIRILPRLQGLGSPETPSRTLIYATSGKRKGQLIATSGVPGEILRVAAGDYLIESRFVAGNATALATIKVKPGVLNTIEIDHAAGLARLAYADGADAAVTWSIADEQGRQLSQFEGQAAEIVLQPGIYTVSATADGKIVSAPVAIEAGEARDIVLGN